MGPISNEIWGQKHVKFGAISDNFPAGEITALRQTP